MAPERIRRADRSDLGGVLDLLGELGRPCDAQSPPAVREAAAAIIARPDTEVLVAELDGRLVGLASLQTLPRLGHATPEARLLDLIVGEAARGSGIGRRLVEAAHERAAAAGCHLIRLECGHARTSQDFYRRLGFESRGEDWQLPLDPAPDRPRPR
ncbi:MAG: GNAT family N-acetyltransferase [Solirubrobacterales bacterium]